MTEVLAWIGYVAVAAIILIVLFDVSGRYFFNKPLAGSLELVELAMTILAGFAIMYTAVKRGHVAIDLLVGRFSRRIQIIMQILTSLLGFVAWGWLDYWLYLRALKTPKLTDVLYISNQPFLFAFAIAMTLSCLTLLIQAFHPVVSEEKKEPHDEL